MDMLVSNVPSAGPVPVFTLAPTLTPDSRYAAADWVDLSSGNQALADSMVSFDCRLIEAFGLRVNTATVTGESLPKARDTEPSSEDSPLYAKNVVLAGTSVVWGCQAKGVGLGPMMSVSAIWPLPSSTPSGSVSCSRTIRWAANVF